MKLSEISFCNLYFCTHTCRWIRLRKSRKLHDRENFQYTQSHCMKSTTAIFASTPMPNSSVGRSLSSLNYIHVTQESSTEEVTSRRETDPYMMLTCQEIVMVQERSLMNIILSSCSSMAFSLQFQLSGGYISRVFPTLFCQLELLISWLHGHLGGNSRQIL